MSDPHARPLAAPAALSAAGLALSAFLFAGAAAGREWHVSQKELPGVGGDTQLRSIAEAAKQAEAGDTVVIHGGVYREQVVVEKSGTRTRPVKFLAATGGKVIVTGADRITDWRREHPTDGVFSAPWPHRFIGWNKNMTHPGDDYHLMIGRSEQVFVLGYPLLQVLARERLARGTFHVDTAGRRIYVWSRDNMDLAKGSALVEASARTLLWESRGDHVHVRGIRFRYAANMAQHGAVKISGDHNVIEDCVLEMMNSSGATLTGANMVVRRCTFQDNGQLGFSANRAHDLLFTGCVVRNNNVKGYSRGWEAGADKLVFCRKAVLEKSMFVGNRGSGVWFDIGNEDCVVRNCLIADNEDAGIFYEISYGLHAHDNVIVGNGFADTPGSWGAAAGISLSSSPGCVIERNLLVGNKEGFNFREQDRKTPLIDDEAARWVWNHDQTIRNNVMAYNRDAQAWGWFDINDGRHWPRALQGGEFGGGEAPEDMAAKYRAQGEEGKPVGLSLEKLKITFEQNLYYPGPGQGLFNWGVTWKKHKRYGSLEEVRGELGFERGGRVAEFVFEDFLTRDFRVPSSSPALRMRCYPKGKVPGARLRTASRRAWPPDRLRRRP